MTLFTVIYYIYTLVAWGIAVKLLELKWPQEFLQTACGLNMIFQFLQQLF